MDWKEDRKKIALYRLTTLWAFCEVGLGGILHAAKIPLTGFLVGAMAVIILAIIAKVDEKNTFKNIIQALLIVLLVKITVTPHAGPGAYLAVGFQGLLAALLYPIMNFKLASLIIGIVTMLESAAQKIVTLYVFYGETLVEGVNSLAKNIERNFGMINGFSALDLVIFYLSVYAIWGFIIGLLSIKISNDIQKKTNINKYQIETKSSESISSQKPKKSILRKLFIPIAILFLLIVYLLSEGQFQNILYLLIRVIVVFLIIFKVIAPILNWVLKKFLERKKSSNLEYMNMVLDGLPNAGYLTKLAWKENKSLPLFSRIYGFFIDSILYNLYYIADE